MPSDDSQQTVWHNAGFEDPNLVTSDPESGNSLLGPIGYQCEEMLVESETIGAPVISRRWIDRSEGSILVLESHRFAVDGVIDRWSMYSTSENAVTPLILNEKFEITGIGQARVSDGSGLQELDFKVEDGSADILPGYHLGFWDGADGKKTPDPFHVQQPTKPCFGSAPVIRTSALVKLYREAVDELEAIRFKHQRLRRSHWPSIRISNR
ncbi:MAG: hypothetical protein P8N76_11470 [Pirellulaceae bacterium]|nr:hypothetical protein [Pirellulaceae bacterium]